MNKENVLKNFDEMIKNSWTYDRMTIAERKKWDEILFNEYPTRDCLKGTYNQRWKILNALYRAYLMGIGYTNFNWRENNE